MLSKLKDHGHFNDSLLLLIMNMLFYTELHNNRICNINYCTPRKIIVSKLLFHFGNFVKLS